ncbi:MAG: hypothetical protein ACQ5SW_03795 [Sphaerochaetaceae bacterium]
MKKLTLTTLLILILSSFALFAADDTDAFDVVATINGIHEIKLVTPGTTVPATKAEFDALTTNNTDYTINDSNYDATQTVRQLVSMSNNRAGYYMTLSATAMAADLGSSEYAYINYIVIAGGASLTTNNATAVTATSNIYESGALTGMDFHSTDVTISVNEGQYENAVTGSYSGTVTFNLFAN